MQLLALKFTKFFVSFLETRVSFSSKFASLFGVMRHGQNEPMKVQIFRYLTARMKINQTLYIIFQATSQLTFKF